MVVHPAGLSAASLYAIDQFVLRGGHLLVFVDPNSELASPGGGMAPHLDGLVHVDARGAPDRFRHHPGQLLRLAGAGAGAHEVQAHESASQRFPQTGSSAQYPQAASGSRERAIESPSGV